MSHDIFRSILGALALVTVSGCAVETSTPDVAVVEEEEEERSSTAVAAPEGDDGHYDPARVARTSTMPVPSTEASSSREHEPHGPYPVPWSARRD